MKIILDRIPSQYSYKQFEIWEPIPSQELQPLIKLY